MAKASLRNDVVSLLSSLLAYTGSDGRLLGVAGACMEETLSRSIWFENGIAIIDCETRLVSINIKT